MEDDAFWDIQLTGHSLSQCRDGIASIERSDSSARRGSNDSDENLSYEWKTMTLPFLDDTSNVTLDIRTACQASIMDRHVGEEVWDAAIIFCAYLCMTKDMDVPASGFRLKGRRVLELGSGVGLLGLTAALFADRTLLTDYDPDVLINLVFNATHNKTRIHQCNQGELEVSQLNWNCFLGNDLMNEDWIDGTITKDYKMDNSIDVDILIGSALVYSIQGAYACADTIVDFLTKRKGREAWVLQLVSRPGFDRFLRRLEQQGLTYTRFEIGEREYHLATGIEALKTPRDQFGLFVISPA